MVDSFLVCLVKIFLIFFCSYFLFRSGKRKLYFTSFSTVGNHTQGGCLYLQIWSLNLIFFVQDWKDDHNRLVCSGIFLFKILLWVQFLMLACCCWLLLCHCPEETQNISCEFFKIPETFSTLGLIPLPAFFLVMNSWSCCRLAAVRQLIYGFNVTTRTWLLNLLGECCWLPIYYCLFRTVTFPFFS